MDRYQLAAVDSVGFNHFDGFSFISNYDTTNREYIYWVSVESLEYLNLA